MTLKTDLEKHIRESYRLIQQYEDILRLSDDPKEQMRAQRNVQEQHQLIKRYLAEYVPLCEDLNLAVPEDIVLLTVTERPNDQSSQHFRVTQHYEDAPSTLHDPHNHPDDLGPVVKHAAVERRGSAVRSLEELRDIPKNHLWGQFLILLVFLISIIEGIVGIFEVPSCSRRVSMAVFLVSGGNSDRVLEPNATISGPLPKLGSLANTRPACDKHRSIWFSRI
jgi:hypothetical protein